MTKAIELASYLDEYHEGYEVEGTSIFTRSADELRRLAAVEQELTNLKAAMGEPSHIKSKKQTAHELDAMKKYIEKITKDKDSAVGFLTRAGIIDGSGELAEQYRNIESKAKP